DDDDNPAENFVEDEDPFDGPSETKIVVGDKEITLTREDAHEMKTALVKYLTAAKIPEREYLLRMLQEVPGWIDEDGTLRIGAWLLGSRGDALALTNRLPHAPAGCAMYHAHVERVGDGWRVTGLDFERVQYRP